MTGTNLSTPGVILKTPIDLPKASFLKKVDGVAGKVNLKHLQLITGQKVF